MSTARAMIGSGSTPASAMRPGEDRDVARRAVLGRPRSMSSTCAVVNSAVTFTWTPSSRQLAHERRHRLARRRRDRDLHVDVRSPGRDQPRLPAHLRRRRRRRPRTRSGGSVIRSSRRCANVRVVGQARLPHQRRVRREARDRAGRRRARGCRRDRRRRRRSCVQIRRACARQANCASGVPDRRSRQPREVAAPASRPGAAPLLRLCRCSGASTRIVRQPAAAPASTSASESPIIHDRRRSTSSSRRRRAASPARGLRQSHGLASSATVACRVVEAVAAVVERHALASEQPSTRSWTPHELARA